MVKTCPGSTIGSQEAHVLHVGPAVNESAAAVRLRLRLPDRCIRCGALGSVGLESTLQGSAVHFGWWCRGCGDDWPLDETERELDERRSPTGDRRRIIRSSDRRVISATLRD